MKFFRKLKFKRVLIVGIPFIILVLMFFLPKSDLSNSNTNVPSIFSRVNEQDSTSTVRGDGSNTSSPFEINDYKSDYVYVPTPAEDAKDKLTTGDPVYITDFKTSVGITTTINIYTMLSDPDNVIRIEIYGVNYNNRETDIQKNKDMQAFRDSFIRASEELKKSGINIQDMNVIYGTSKYMNDTANFWINYLDLL